MLCNSMLLRMRFAMVCVVCYVVREWPVSHYITHDAHHSQVHCQQCTLIQHDMLPQHPVNIKELFCEYF